MKNKNFLKIKKTGEERYFASTEEFLSFRDKRSGTQNEEFWNDLLNENPENKRVQGQFAARHNFKHNSLTIIDGFICRILHGKYNHGKHKICIIAEQYVYNIAIDYEIFKYA